jgi:alkylated DNA repair dioxygenase AlkB
MNSSPGFTWQPSLFGLGDEPAIDRAFARLTRIELSPVSWVEHAPAWVSGADALFEQVLGGREWEQRSRQMYDQKVSEPRLTAPWSLTSGKPLEPPILEEIRLVLSERYQREFDSVGFNLYRDGRDSVAWHGDRIPEEIVDPIVVLVSLGEPRRFLLRSKGERASRVFVLGHGDLLVTGGQTQRDWEHSVPKAVQAGPRISLAYRH